MEAKYPVCTQHPLFLQLEPLQMTWGNLAPPLGNTRLHVVKLLASALSTNAAALTQELLVLDVPNTLLVQGLDGLRAGEVEMWAERF